MASAPWRALPEGLNRPGAAAAVVQVLKLSKEKWDEARDHALKAVVADNRMRIW